MPKKILLLLAVLALAASVTLLGPRPGSHRGQAPLSVSEDPPIAQLEAEVSALRETLDRLANPNPYIVIDTVHNRLQIRRGNRILKEAVCATGSGKVLLGPRAKDRWHFETPKQIFHIQRKVKDPIWAKPAWAFIERGRPVPTLPWAFERLDLTTLGKYALELGDGYEIHGTLYPGLLGRHITHGCIRLNEEDLEFTYTLTGTGNRVYIY